MTNSENIVVTGATGQLGRLVVAELLQIAPSAHVIGLVRNVAAAKELAIAVSNFAAPTTMILPQSWLR